MKNIKHALTAFLFSICAVDSFCQYCSNIALVFDGDDDYITLNTTGTSLTPNSVFTVEATFTITSLPTTCTTNFRKLFSLSGPGTKVELGECNGELRLNWRELLGGTPPGNIPISIPPVLSSDCHHVALVRSATDFQIYLDGNLTPLYSIPFTGSLNTNLFRVGHWDGGASPGEDWDGMVDDVRLWNIIRTPAQIRDFTDCALSSSTGSISGLIANWTFNQAGINPGNPNTGYVAEDMTGNNDGMFSTGPNGFMLNGFTSNFQCNGCIPKYELSIDDNPSQFPVSLGAICSGSSAHFCVTQGGVSVGSIPGASVIWESSDDSGINWNLLTLPFDGYCFYVPSLDISLACGSSNSGFVDRLFRGSITKTMGPQTCTYFAEGGLHIDCPVSNAQLVYSFNSPTLINGTICEGNVDVDLSIVSSLPFLVNLGSNISIEWYVDGNHQNCDNQLTCHYSGITPLSQICFEARIYNFTCSAILTKCFNIDPLPLCGIIDQMSNLTSIGLYQYEICPGTDAIVGMVNPASFQHCNPKWQFHFDNPSGPWQDLGASNQNQNTNILPQTHLPNPTTLNNGSPNPYLWPSTANCIFYRIVCDPLTHPNSGCPPCTSNEIEICLKQNIANYTLTGAPSQICASGGFSTLTINPTPPVGSTINWYNDGIQFGGSAQITASQGGCYWATIDDGCYAVTTNKFCIQACEVVAIIDCPQDNPCACSGQPLTLIGCNSYNTCGPTGPLPLQYYWSASTGANPIPTGPNGCNAIHTPDPLNGTYYTLTVVDPNIFCLGISKTLLIKPCI